MTSEASSSLNQEPTDAQSPSGSNSRYVGILSCRYGNWLSSSIPIVMCGVYFAAVIVTVSKAAMEQLMTAVNLRETSTVKLTLMVRVARMAHGVNIQLLSQVISTKFSFLNKSGHLTIRKNSLH